MNQQPPSQEARSASFQQLKPICIKLSEVALREKPDPRQLNIALAALQDKVKNIPVLDAKLADYAFFPLSYVIKNAGLIPEKTLAVGVRCLEVLVRRGWQSKPDSTLTRELLVFLTIQLSRKPHDDLLLAILHCTTTLIRCTSKIIAELLVDAQTDNSALAGQLIDTLLDIIKESPSIEIQIEASTTLKQSLVSLEDEELLRKYLPGIVSQLSHILSSKSRRTHRVLVVALESISTLVKTTLYDGNDQEEPTPENKSWRQATASQLLLVISSFISLRYHERPKVRQALADLCSLVLVDCQPTLENCASLCLETLCAVSSQDEAVHNDLDMVINNQNLKNPFQDLLLKWLQALPRKLQSQDEQAAQRHVDLVCEAYRALRVQSDDLSSLDHELQQAIEASARLLLNDGKQASKVADLPDMTIKDLVVANPSLDTKPLGTLATKHLMLLQGLIASLQPPIAIDQQQDTLSSLWILRQSLASSISPNQWLDSFIESPAPTSEILDLALTRALDVLNTTTPFLDWRSQALSLDLLSLISQVEGADFRTSLVDILFPMVELLGTSDPYLRQYAIRSLNSVSHHCGYEAPGDMIVQNVDYLVNAIALKFNTFDVSPQAAQVLVMMLELSGPGLIPYLDDLVDSIFGALAAYHGYPRLVEVMFEALAAIVRHGSSAASGLMERPVIEHKKQQPQRAQIADIPAILARIRNPPSLPEDLDDDEEDDQPPSTALQPSNHTEIDKPTPPKTYTLLESILRLSQHYLTHQSPYLRQRLLELISTGCQSLSRNEESFLPLVNDIWPVLIKRLYDEEAIVSLAAMGTVCALFQAAGDFLASRIQDEWPSIRKLFRALEGKVLAERKSKGGRGIWAYSERLYEGVVEMMINLIMHVRVDAGMEDDLFEMLGGLSQKRDDVWDALEVLNSDALWLLEIQDSNRPLPQMEGYQFVALKLQ